MKTKQLKVGMSARVFIVTKKGEDFFGGSIKEGSLFSERMDGEYNDSEYGVNSPYLINGQTPYHFGIDSRRNQAQLVGKLTITKLK